MQFRVKHGDARICDYIAEIEAEPCAVADAFKRDLFATGRSRYPAMRNRLHCEIVFGSEHNSAAHELYGLQMPDPELTWSRGTESAVVVPAVASRGGIGIELVFGGSRIPTCSIKL